MRKENVLVTGGAGYIGSHVCKALAKTGRYVPITYDNLCNGHLWAVKWGPLVQGDLHDADALKKAMRDYQPASVIHLASLINARESADDPSKYYDNNVTGTLVLLDAMRASGVNHLVFSSSAAVYGSPKRIPIDEQHEKNPQSPYGKSKYMVEEILQDYCRGYDLTSISLRYFNAAGADLDGEIGEAHDPETHLIPLAIQAALGLRPALSLFGQDFPTKDGTPVRDYIHVSDLAEAHVRALEWLMRERGAFSLNLGTGRGYSVHAVLKQVEKIVQKPVPVQLAPRHPSDPPELIADAKAAQKLLSWNPICSDLPTLIRSAYTWHCSQLKNPAVQTLSSFL